MFFVLILTTFLTLGQSQNATAGVGHTATFKSLAACEAALAGEIAAAEANGAVAFGGCHPTKVKKVR